MLYGAGADLRAAFVSDLHDESYESLLRDIRKADVDVILVGGDVVHDKDHTKNGIDFLRDAAAIAPTFCSLGNHELKNVENIRVRIAETGAVLLDNSFTCFKGLVIGGLTTGFSGAKQRRTEETPAPDMAWLPTFIHASGTHVLLSHHPEYYPRYLCDQKMELILSGHAHGGQWRFFGQGVFAPGQGLLPRFTSGAYQEKKKIRKRAVLSQTPTLIVSRGLANHSCIPRLNNPLEWLLIQFTTNLP